MKHGHNVLALIPARGGSRGIPGKNLQDVGGLSLVARAARVARSCPWIDRVVLSTDSDAIAAEGRAAGAEVPFMRPPELASDTASAVGVIAHAVDFLRADGWDTGVVLLLEPSSPFRTPRQLEECVDMLIDTGADSVVTVSPVTDRHHPLKVFRVGEGRLEYWDPRGRGIVQRQQLERVYTRNGVAYALWPRTIAEHKSVIGPHTRAYIIEETSAVNIDEPADLELARKLAGASKADEG